MKYIKKKISTIESNPVGIWQANKQTYYFLDVQYSFSLIRDKVRIEQDGKEIFDFKFNGSISKALSKCLKLLDLKKASMFGFISYDYARYLEDIKNFLHDKDWPDFHFIIPSSYVIEKDNGDLFFYQAESYCKKQSENKKRCNLYSAKKTKLGLIKDKDEFCKITHRAQDYIKSGDVFQIVLSNQIEFENQICPNELYYKILKKNPSAYHFLLNFQDKHLVGSSPETMLEYDSMNRKLKMRLVAGTYPKESKDFKTDPKLLLKDEKELAEHMMLVDHCRNDLGRHSEIGSVEVVDLLKLVPLNDIYHLVSEVNSTLKTDKNCLDALEASFPIATLTGTPKIRAMEIISELEQSPRRLFGGAVGLIETTQNMSEQKLDLAVIIRSAYITKEQSYINAGAGIVLDSIAEREYHECLWKVKTLTDIIE